MASIPERVTVIDHPLVADRLAKLRDARTPSRAFRKLVTQLTVLAGIQATRDLPLTPVDVQTAMGTAHCGTLASADISIVPVLRAGIGMLDGMLELLPDAHVGFLGLFRDEATHLPMEYYDKLPAGIEDHDCVFVVDPMLATGGTAVHAIDLLRKQGVEKIRLIVLIAAPEGLAAVLDADPNVEIYACAVDEGLNPDAYIVPGLGDAGDRIFQTC